MKNVHFIELEDEKFRQIIESRLKPEIRNRYVIASITWCLFEKKWLIKLTRRSES